MHCSLWYVWDLQLNIIFVNYNTRVKYGLTVKLKVFLLMFPPVWINNIILFQMHDKYSKSSLDELHVCASMLSVVFN